MKGQGGPVPELDFPEGSDMMSDLRSDPDGGRRMEFELYTRLSGHEEASMPPRIYYFNILELHLPHALLRF